MYINPLATSPSYWKGCEHRPNPAAGPTYKLKPVRVPIGQSELVDIPIIHPL